MQRRQFLRTGAGMGLGLLPASTWLASRAGAAEDGAARPIAQGAPLEAPARGKIRTAFAIADRATVIDFAGPWEVFQDVHVPGRGSSHDDMMPFELYTVAATTKPVTATAGLKIIPNYSIENAPQPHLVIVPALRGNDALLGWLAAVAPKTDVTLSVCTGAFQLGRAGLLDGLVATTHHDFYDDFAEEFPNVQLERGLRFVENRRIATAGGLTSGIDLALRIVERYFGREVAQRTADYMEYTSGGWKV